MSCSPNYKILAGEIDLGFGFTVNPCKVEMAGGNVPITVKNQTDKDKLFSIYSDGVTLSVDQLVVKAHSEKTIMVSLEQGRTKEASVTFKDESNTYINHALKVRLLLKGGENK